MSGNASRTPPSLPRADLTYLKGHQGSVLCLDYNCADSSFGCLLSGSEDCTARLWDLRVAGSDRASGDDASPAKGGAERLRASLCIKAPSEVVSVAFSSSHRSASVALTSPFSRDFSVFLSTNNSIREYDLRRAASPLIVISRGKDATCPVCVAAEDEVSQVVVSQQKGIAAAVDDDGTLCVWRTDQNHQVQSAGVENTMMTTVAIRPHTPKSAQAVTGSTDGCVRLWDVGSGRRLKLLDAVDMNVPNAQDASTSSIQICNPPMVHHVSFSPSGRLLAAALGDGSISLTKVGARGFGTTSRLSDAHGGPVASVVFGNWIDASQNRRVDAADRLLCSAGNDGAIVFWDLGSSACGSPSQQFIDEFQRRLNIGPAGAEGEHGNDNVNASDDEPRTLFAIQHGSKPNWMVNSRVSDPCFPSTLFLADTSTDISAYTIPS
jgi:WD repeat-containing protein 53